MSFSTPCISFEFLIRETPCNAFMNWESFVIYDLLAADLSR